MSRDAPRPLRAAELIEHPDGALARLAQPAGRPNPDGALAQALRPEPESAIELHHPAHRLELLGLLGPIERLHHPHQVPRRGDPRPDNLMYRVFKPAARAAGMPELTFHDLRHTGASLMIAAGCHVKVIAEQMGHSDGGGLVLKRYGHLYKGARRQAAVALEAHLFGGAGDSAVGQAWDDGQLGLDLDPA